MKVLTFADLHLRGTVPPCVNATPTEWMEIQEKALIKVADIALENKVNGVYIGGDIFHSEVSCNPECVNIFLNFVNTLDIAGIKVFIMAGNHDLPGHSSTNLEKSFIGILFNHPDVHKMVESDSYICGCNFDIDDYEGEEKIFKHVLCIPEEQKPPMVECETPQTLLERYPLARYIFTGDYHKKFAYADNGRFVINSGCLTRQAADFEDYETGVFVVDFATDDVKWCPVNISQKFVKNGNEKKTDKTIDDFANGIQQESVTLDFIGALKNEVSKQKQPVQEKVNSWITEIGQ